MESMEEYPSMEKHAMLGFCKSSECDGMSNTYLILQRHQHHSVHDAASFKQDVDVHEVTITYHDQFLLFCMGTVTHHACPIHPPERARAHRCHPSTATPLPTGPKTPPLPSSRHVPCPIRLSTSSKSAGASPPASKPYFAQATPSDQTPGPTITPTHI